MNTYNTTYFITKQGDLICLEGPVGGGKSALIDAIVAGINCTSGSVCVHELTSGILLYDIYIFFSYIEHKIMVQVSVMYHNRLGYSAALYATTLFGAVSLMSNGTKLLFMLVR